MGFNSAFKGLIKILFTYSTGNKVLPCRKYDLFFSRSMLMQNVGVYKFNKFFGVKCLKLHTPIHNQMTSHVV